MRREHILPGRQLSVSFHLFIIDRLSFPLRMFFSKLSVHVFGMVFEFRVKQKRSANGDNAESFMHTDGFPRSGRGCWPVSL